MKKSSWLLGALGVALLTGVVFLTLGLLRSSPVAVEESAGGSGKPLFAEAIKKGEAVRQLREGVKKKAKSFAGLSGSEGEHRVFVSAQLVYLPENPEPVQPLNRKMKTEDGIEVGWKIDHGLDPADPGIKELDPDGDGFTNLEEFMAKTDPNKKEDSPAKESKLKSRSGDPVALSVSFPEKSGGFYTIRFQVGSKRKELKGKPGDAFWVMAGPEGVEIFSEEAKGTVSRAKAKEAGLNDHLIPLKFVSYEERVEKIKDAKAGGVEVEVDNSIVVLQREDALRGVEKLVFSTPQKPQALTWDVGDIRLFSPASGGVDLGPFRLGEVFEYEGKRFAVIGREDKKIKLQDVGNPGREPFWVPPESLSAFPEKSP